MTQLNILYLLHIKLQGLGMVSDNIEIFDRV